MPTPEQILAFLKQRAGEVFRPAELMEELRIPVREKREVRTILRDLSQSGQLVRFTRGAYTVPEKQPALEGLLQVNSKGDGFLVVPGKKQEDIFIPRRALGPAIHGDRVEAMLVESRGGEREGRVIRVVTRAHPTLVGQFIHTPEGGVVLPKERKIRRRVRILRRHSRDKVPEGAWVIVKITHWSDSSEEPLIGNVVEVLGSEGDPGIDILVLLRSEGIQIEFPPEVLAETEGMRGSINETEIVRRLDLRKAMVFTIDPETAKDFDDALSIEPLPGGDIRLGVHIADVAHFVRVGTALDKEAYDRATSIYPVDRVVPMLPPMLSDELCSLQPRLDRFTMSVFMDIGAKGEVHRSEIAESVINSQLRFTYEQAQALLEGKPFEGMESFGHALEDLTAIRDLSKRLTRVRMARGALDLDLPEVDVIFNKRGEVSDVRPHPRLDAHRLVEECMLLANETVAQRVLRQNLPALFRVHEEPDPESLEKLRGLLAPFGVKFPKGNIDSFAVQAALERLEGREGGSLITRYILRALKKAVYSERNLGHYGLASKAYCHFTSPIRRYPDLIVHRVLKESLAPGGMPARRRQELAEAMPEMAAHTSGREQRATSIDRDATAIKSLEFMKPRIGEIVDGLVSGIVSFGLFVELKPWPIEGLIPMRSLDDDFYDFDDAMHCLRGRRSGRVFRIADPVRVVIERVDPPARQMDLGLVQKGKAAALSPKSERRLENRPLRVQPKRGQSKFHPPKRKRR